MVVLDVSIVNVALPAMRGALDLSPTGVQWVVNAYALGFAGLLLFGGRAADLFGAKPVFLTGLIGFTAASLAGGMADTGGLLIAARSVQGLAGAVLAPATMTLIMTTFTDPRERTKALGAWSATMAAGGAMGAVVGGMLTQWVSWRWVLFVNVPIGAGADPGGRAADRPHPRPRRHAAHPGPARRDHRHARPDRHRLRRRHHRHPQLGLGRGARPDDGRRGAAGGVRAGWRRAASTPWCRCACSGTARWPWPTSPRC